MDDLVAITPTDLLGNGTACLVWSSPLTGDAQRQMRYVNLTGEQKPHLLTKIVNNLGAETRVAYAPSTKFYLQDKRDGKPWITRLPFPVHVVERVETHDRISGNRFVTLYTYHHGYFDGEEREFRGFGMVEQRDTEEFAALTADGRHPEATNLDAASHVPPVLTRTWFHTGLWLGGNHVSDFFAGLLNAHDRGEYYREPAWRDDEEARKRLLPDTIMPPGLTIAEEREACRALKGAMLRQEVYAIDGMGTADYPFGHPYIVTEQNFTVECLQPKGGNRHAVFCTHPREAITYHYERRLVPVLNGQIVDKPTAESDPNTQWLLDPRIQHALTLEVDVFGNVLKEAAIGYRRRQPDATLPLQADRDKQQIPTLVTYTENLLTNAIDDTIKNPDGTIKYPDQYRTPLPAETRTYELTGFAPEDSAVRISFDEWAEDDFALLRSATEINYELQADPSQEQKRLIEHVRTLYRKNDLTGPSPLGEVESRALPYESYKLAFTPKSVDQIYRREVVSLIPDSASILLGAGADRGGYVHSEGDANWWIPSGRVFFAPKPEDELPVIVGAPPSDVSPAQAAAELLEAEAHFFLPRRFRDPFGATTSVRYDDHKLLMLETRDTLANTVTAANDYRVLHPRLVTDPNRNRMEVAFDILGMVVATAVKGKDETVGDTLSGLEPDLTQAQVDGFYDVEDPHVPAPDLLKGATTRITYDLDRFRRTQQAHPDEPAKWLPVYAATLARETHVSDTLPPQALKIQISFSYSDGFGREIQKKIQAEPGPLVDGGPVVSRRWVGSSWTIFNNKGKPVRQYEPFFSQLPEKRHRFEFGVKIGVSSILFYDPLERVVARLHANHAWEKVVYGPWLQETWDLNDTATIEPQNDEDVKGFFVNADGTSRLPAAQYLPTWHALRTDPVHGAEANRLWPDPKIRDGEKAAAKKSAVHEKTPAVAHLDTLGRTYLTVTHNRFARNGTVVEEKYPTRVELDIEGNQRAVRDAILHDDDPLGRIVMRYDYDMLGNRIHQASMESGERWMLNDVMGNPIRAWDSRGFMRRMTYDELRRPITLYVTEDGAEREAERTVYGEGRGDSGNHRTRICQVFDSAGVITSERYDFKGNLLDSRRDLLPDYKQAVDWGQNPVANDGSFPTSTTYDALNRPRTVTTPDRSVYRATFNEANLLDKVDVSLRGAGGTTNFIANIDYNAKGQRSLIRYGNDAQTSYDYDPLTFRLVRLKTTRPAGLDRNRRGYSNRPFGDAHRPGAGEPGNYTTSVRCSWPSEDRAGNTKHEKPV